MRIQGAMENEPLIDPAMKAELSALYRAPDRHYHGLSHIEALLALAQEYRTALSDPDAVEAAIWFHDAIYDSRRSDNETRSAAACLGEARRPHRPGEARPHRQDDRGDGDACPARP